MSMGDHNIDMVEFGKSLYFHVFYHNSKYFELLISLGFFVCLVDFFLRKLN